MSRLVSRGGRIAFTEAGSTRAEVAGSMTVHGIERPIRLDLTVSDDDGHGRRRGTPL